MEQSKLESIVESTLNVLSGTIVSFLLWVYVIIPIWDIEVTMTDNVVITAIFSVSAIIRGYLWRRLFNANMHRKLHVFLRRFV